MIPKPFAIQITMKNGIHVTVGVESFEEYAMYRDKIKKDNSKWIDIIDACTVKKEDICLIEFVENQSQEEKANEN